MAVEGVDTSIGGGLAFADVASAKQTAPRAATSFPSSRKIPSGQAFGTDRNFLSARGGSGRLHSFADRLEIWIGALSLAFNVAILMVVLVSALWSARAASVQSYGIDIFLIDATVPSSFSLAPSCQSDRRVSCGG